MTRDEEIGRAAFAARDFGDAMWEDLTPGCRDDQTRLALAAVSRAREIDGTDLILAAAHDMWMKAVTVVYHAKQAGAAGEEITGTTALDDAMREYERHIRDAADRHQPKEEA